MRSYKSFDYMLRIIQARNSRDEDTILVVTAVNASNIFRSKLINIFFVLIFTLINSYSVSARSIELSLIKSQDPVDYIEKNSKMKSDIVLCYDRHAFSIDKIKNFTNYFFKEKFKIHDGYFNKTIDDATFVYIGNYPIAADAYECINKYPSLADYLNTDFDRDQQSRREKDRILDSRLKNKNIILLPKPSIDGYFKSNSDQIIIIKIIIYQIEKYDFDRDLIYILFSLEPFFCQHFDCNEAFK